MHPSELNLSEYVDGELIASEREAIAGHLERCRACQALVADFTELRRASAALGTMEPPARAWARIAESIVGDRRPSVDGRQSTSHGPADRDVQDNGDPPTSLHQGFGSSPEIGRRPKLDAAEARHDVRRWTWLAAAAALILATAGSVWLVRAPLGDETAPALEAATAQAVEAELAQAEQHYERAITGLEQIANAEKGALDPRTAATLQENMGMVDQAINESRAALTAQPASDPARRSLLDSFKAKIELLQNTIALINDMRTGDDAGAAQVISRLKRGN